MVTHSAKYPFTEAVVNYFNHGDTRIADSVVYANYMQDDSPPAQEYFDSYHHRVPMTRGIWQRLDTHPLNVRICLVFPSVVEAMSFAQVRRIPLDNTGNHAMISTGIRPSRYQIVRLKEDFPNSKFQLIFGNDFLARVFDCAVAAWTLGKDPKFLLADRKLSVCLGANARQFDISKISLSAFERSFGIRSKIRTYKPKGNYRSFKEMLLSKSQ